MKTAVLGALCIVVAVFEASCTVPVQAVTAQSTTSGTPSPLPPCVAGFKTGQVLKLSLGQIYDAKSDYAYDPSASFLHSAGSSCKGADGIMTGSVVVFTPQKELASAQTWNGSACAPWAEFDPAALESTPNLVVATFNSVMGMTIAGSFSEGSLAGNKAFVVAGLYTPSMDPNGPLTPRQLPPLVVSRTLQPENWMNGCSDAWVATWIP